MPDSSKPEQSADRSAPKSLLHKSVSQVASIRLQAELLMLACQRGETISAQDLVVIVERTDELQSSLAALSRLEDK